MKHLYAIKNDMDYMCNYSPFGNVVRCLTKTSPIKMEIDFSSLKWFHKTVYLALKYKGKPKRTRKDYRRFKVLLRRLRLK